MSIDPTPYDLDQDSRIEGLREIITTSYETENAIEVSFPVVDRPMNDDEWGALAKAWGSGIISFGQWPYRLNIDSDADVTNQVRITPATDVATKDSVGVIEGFAHRLLEDKLLTVPAVTTRTRYLIALQYDPVRAESEGIPIVLDVFAGTLDQSQGKKYALIHEGYRDPSTVLSQMEWKGVRSRLAPTITVHQEASLPNPQHSGLIWGTRCLCTSEGTEWMLGHHEDEDVTRMDWHLISDPEWKVFTLAGSRGNASHGYTSSYQKKGRKVRLRGHITRPGGNFTVGAEWVLGTLPTSARPLQDHVEVTAVSGQSSPKYARITVEPSGRIVAYVSDESSWVSIDGVEFDVE